MKIALSGIGKMGSQIAKKLSEGGHTVVAHNRSREPIDELVSSGVQPAYEKQDVVSAFADQRVILWLMIPSEVVDEELDSWAQILPKGSLIIDGGNSDFRKTKLRAEKLSQSGLNFVDAGVSGGVWGYQNGFSIMVGGNESDVKMIEPVLECLTLPEGAFSHFGPAGAGHFVKMVHNAIEYGMMESLAEGYRMLKEGPFEKLNLYEAAYVWQHHSVVTSWLNSLIQDIMKENPGLNGIDGYVADTGEARWALEEAKERDLPMPSIQVAFDIRIASQHGQVNFATKLLAAMRNKFGGHNLNKP